MVVCSYLIQYTRWKWGKSPARIDFWYPILVQNDNKKKNKGSQMEHTDKKIFKKNLSSITPYHKLNIKRFLVWCECLNHHFRSVFLPRHCSLQNGFGPFKLYILMRIKLRANLKEALFFLSLLNRCILTTSSAAWRRNKMKSHSLIFSRG
jgi:hypothetical protein